MSKIAKKGYNYFFDRGDYGYLSKYNKSPYLKTINGVITVCYDKSNTLVKKDKKYRKPRKKKKAHKKESAIIFKMIRENENLKKIFVV